MNFVLAHDTLEHGIEEAESKRYFVSICHMGLIELGMASYLASCNALYISWKPFLSYKFVALCCFCA